MQIKDAVVLLAGLGTRCYPFSYVMPKCMIPILNRPVIEYVVEELMLSGIENIYFVLPKIFSSKICIQHFKQNKKVLNLLKNKNSLYYEKIISRKFPKIIPVFSKVPNGSGGAVLQCEKYLKNKTFVIVNGDDLFFGDVPATKELISLATQKKASVVACLKIDVKDNCKYGMAITKQENNFSKMIGLVEKPQNNNQLDFAVVGRYIVNSDIFKYLKQTPKVNGEIFFTVALDKYAQNNNVYCTTLSSTRYDCGNLQGILNATFDLTKNDCHLHIW